MKEVQVHVITLIPVATWNTGKGELLVAGIEHTHSMSHRFSFKNHLFGKSNPLNSKF